jgi:hypothetical protein
LIFRRRSRLKDLISAFKETGAMECYKFVKRDLTELQPVIEKAERKLRLLRQEVADREAQGIDVTDAQERLDAAKQRYDWLMKFKIEMAELAGRLSDPR